MKFFWIILSGAFAVIGAQAVGAEPEAFSGHWALDVKASSAISPWTAETLTIDATQAEVRITRLLSWDDARSAVQVTNAKTDGQTVTANPVTYWVETWYNNAYIGGDRTEKVKAQWLDVGRVLKLETELTLNLQQGDRPVHLYDEYHLSANGQTLRLYELRSTRDQPLIYIFNRKATGR